jgi:spore coat protein A, manganese oxidase
MRGVGRASSTRTFVFQGGPSSFPPVAHWTVNGHDFEPEHPIASPRFDDVEIWRIVNHKRLGILGRLHPVHTHLVRFRILERNGRAALPHERDCKDTVPLEKGDEVPIVMRFDGSRGRYLMHCHNLEYEDHSMMARFGVV